MFSQADDGGEGEEAVATRVSLTGRPGVLILVLGQLVKLPEGFLVSWTLM